MARTKTITLYTFDELSDKAKERARDWYRSCRDSNDFEHVISDAVCVLEILGVSLSTHEVRLMGGSTRRDPNVWWQVGYMQSDGAAFEGSYWIYTQLRTEDEYQNADEQVDENIRANEYDFDVASNRA